MLLNFQPKYDKIVELLLYLAHVKRGADKYQAVKFFYLADREHLLRYGRPITYERYVALEYGPVASNVKDLLEQKPDAFRRAGIAELPFEVKLALQANGKQYVEIGAPLREIDRDIFSKSDLKVFDEVLAKYGNYDFDRLFRLTHGHKAYVNAWSKRGTLKMAEMSYDEMIESPEKRRQIVEDFGPISRRM